MDEATFQRELSKYKTIRSPDYYKPRNKVKTHKVEHTKTQQVSSKGPSNSTTLNANESNFWELLSTSNSSILTTVESIKFIEALKQEHEMIRGKVNLSDLEILAAEVLKSNP